MNSIEGGHIKIFFDSFLDTLFKGPTKNEKKKSCHCLVTLTGVVIVVLICAVIATAFAVHLENKKTQASSPRELNALNSSFVNGKKLKISNNLFYLHSGPIAICLQSSRCHFE